MADSAAEAAPGTPPAAAQADNRRRWAAFGILLLASFINLVDVTIINVAIPRLQASFGASDSDIQWVVAGYVLVFALGLLPFGRLGDLLGRRRLFLFGVAGFTFGSALCGLAPTVEALIGARILQGITAAMMMPQVLAIAQVMFAPHERAVAFSLFGVTAGLASVSGPLAGGALIALDLWGLDWRPIFLVNIPIGLVAIIAGRLLIPESGQRDRGGLDLVGVALGGLTLLAILYPLIEGRDRGWPLWEIGIMLASLPLAALFVAWQRQRRRAARAELLPLALLRNRSFLTGIAMTVLLFSGMSGFFFIVAIFLQTGFGFTPLQSALTTFPFAVGILLASIASGRLSVRWPRARIAIGALVFGGGMAALFTVALGLDQAVDHWLFAAPLLPCGIGIGIAIAPLFRTILSRVDPRQAGAGSGALQSFQQVGSAVGVAIQGQIFFPALAAGLAAQQLQGPAFAGALRATLIYEIAVALGLAILAASLPRLAQEEPAAGPPPMEV